jgi:Zn-finger domain-containing protein
MDDKPESQKFMGRHQLLDRLISQVGSRELAIGLLRDRGQMEKTSEKLTPEGEKRNNMTAAERAKDRAATAAGLPTTSFRYDPKTNRATRR